MHKILKLVYMKKFFLGIFLLCSVAVSAETIKGSVFNERGESIPFVTVSVLAQDSTLLTGAITDDEGRYEIDLSTFNLQRSTLILQASYVGYQTAFGGPDFVLREETERVRTETIFFVVHRVSASTRTAILP